MFAVEAEPPRFCSPSCNGLRVTYTYCSLSGVASDLLPGFEPFNLQKLISFPGPWHVECPPLRPRTQEGSYAASDHRCRRPGQAVISLLPGHPADVMDSRGHAFNVGDSSLPMGTASSTSAPSASTESLRWFCPMQCPNPYRRSAHTPLPSQLPRTDCCPFPLLGEVGIRKEAAGSSEGASPPVPGDGPVRFAGLSHPSAQDFLLIKQQDILGAI
jgi:hypothetical protein